MPRYVDVEPIEKFITDGLNSQENPYGWVGVKILAEVHYAPTADVAPVVHAHWIYKGSSHYGLNDWCHRFECSVCGREVELDTKKDIAEIPYCHCGAKMDRRAKDEG